MPSQRHLIYLLPRADPEELQERHGLLCTCSSAPLELKIRIPPKQTPSKSATASSSISSGRRASTSRQWIERPRRLPEAEDGALSFSTCTSKPVRTPLESYRQVIAPSTVSKQPTLPRQSTTSSSQQAHSRNSRDLSSSSSPFLSESAASPSSIRASNKLSRHEFTSWKLIAPQVKTISPTSNTYVLYEAFAGVSPTVLCVRGDDKEHTASLVSNVQQMNLDLTISSTAPLYSPGRSEPFPLDFIPFSSSSAISSRAPRQAVPTATLIGAKSSDFKLGTNEASALYEETSSETSASTTSATAINGSSGTPRLTFSTGTTESEASCQNADRRTRPAIGSNGSYFSTTSSAVTTSSGSSLVQNGTEAGDIQLGACGHEYQDSVSKKAPEVGCTCSSPSGIKFIPLTPVSTHPTSTSKHRSSSSFTKSSVDCMSRGSSSDGKRKVPMAYRKEMESVLFAQTAGSSSPSASSLSRRSRNNSRGQSSVPTLTSSIFSTTPSEDIWYSHPSDLSPLSSSRSASETTSPASSIGNASISSIPFLMDAPALINTAGRLHANQDDPFSIGGMNSNVVHVNDLSWYLEKVLWKLGLHRKGRKEFTSVSLIFLRLLVSRQRSPLRTLADCRLYLTLLFVSSSTGSPVSLTMTMSLYASCLNVK